MLQLIKRSRPEIVSRFAAEENEALLDFWQLNEGALVLRTYTHHIPLKL